jgi:hypothetical protein
MSTNEAPLAYFITWTVYANCTRGIREQYKLFVDRPVWTVGGDWQCINSEEELEQVILYANEGQDRKGDPQDSMP